MKDSELIETALADLSRQGRIEQEKSYLQHGTTTVYEHSVHVASVSLHIAESLHLDVDAASLTKGALLHDYFLYDWHRKEAWHRLHGFRHPGTALRNAEQDFDLTKREKDIIVRHMFPLTPCPPKYKESWIVCIADKVCTIREMVGTDD